MLYDNQFCLATMTLYFSAVWTQSGESGNTLKIKCSGMSDERANIFAVPTTTEAECSSRCSVSYIMPSLTKQAFRKDDSVELKPTTLAHSTAKEKPLRYLRGNALGIDSPSGLRPRLNGNAAKARRRSRNALKDNRLWRFADKECRTTKHR